MKFLIRKKVVRAHGGAVEAVEDENPTSKSHVSFPNEKLLNFELAMRTFFEARFSAFNQYGLRALVSDKVCACLLASYRHAVVH